MPVFHYRCAGAHRSRAPPGLEGLPLRPLRRPVNSSGLRRSCCPVGGSLPAAEVVMGSPRVVLLRPKPLVASRCSPAPFPCGESDFGPPPKHRQEVFARSPGLSTNLFRCPQFSGRCPPFCHRSTHRLGRRAPRSRRCADRSPGCRCKAQRRRCAVWSPRLSARLLRRRCGPARARPRHRGRRRGDRSWPDRVDGRRCRRGPRLNRGRWSGRARRAGTSTRRRRGR